MILLLSNGTKRKLNKKKLTIKPILLSEQELSNLKAIIESKHIALCTKHMKVRSYLGGYCMTCNNLPSHEVHYRIAGATIVQRYCEDCLRRENFI